MMDKITQPRMSSGGTVTEQVYGQTRSTPYSMDEYLRGSMYDFPGINVDVAPAAGEDSTTNPASLAPSVLNPVGTGGGGASSPFTSYSVATGLPSFGYEDIDPVDFISKFEKTSPKAKGRSDDSFLKFGINQLDPKNIPLGVASLAIPGAGVFGIAAAELNRRSQKKTADAIMATGKTGGSMYTFQGQTVHRLPGTKQFNGTLGNMTSAEHYRFDEIRRGFIPGTMVETKSRVGSLDAAMGQSNEYIRTGKNTIAYDAGFGAGMDAFGTVHSASGPQGGSASAATALREQLYRDNMNRLGLTIDESRVASEALAMKQALDAGMRNSPYHGGFTHKASNLSDEDYAAAQTLSQQIIQRHLNANTQSGRAAGAARQAEADKKAAEATQRIKEQEAQRQATLQQYDEEDDGGSYGGGRDFSVSTAQQTAGDRYQAMADRGYSGYPFADGGRVGMQMGGTAPQTAPAGFVERPPSQVSEAATVADDKPMSVPEGTFVINAAAVEFAGEGDIAKMLKDAYAKAGKQGSAAPSKEQIDVAVSRGEVIVPPAIAKIIGYDRLEKINNRGKKETKDRIKENGQGRKGAAGGGFLDVGKYAEGDEVLPTPKPSLVDRRRDEALADVELRADLESYIKNDKLARLGWDLYSKGEIDMAGVMLRNVETGQNYKSGKYSGFYFPKEGQEMYPGPVEVAKADTRKTKMPRMAELQTGQSIRTDIPSIYYYAEKNPALKVRRDKDGKIINTPQEMSRAGVFITMAHELRHAALNYLHNEGNLKNVIGTPRAEERLMDYYDYHNRMTASKSDPSMPPISPSSLQAGRQEFASFDPMQRELNEYYENIAAAALKGRKVPPRAKRIKKNFFERFVNELFN